MTVLVLFLGAVIARYAWRYLRRDPGQRRFYGWLAAIVAAVCVLVNADDMRIMALAWTVTSLCLHPLLLFYAERSNARLAAHKKFVLSRLADVCMFGCVSLVGHELHTFSLTALASDMPRAPTLALQCAAFLLVAVALLKTAQLPFHGWLMHVMEAPTPVSALLHAGVVNIAGYVVIRMSPLLEVVPRAQVLLVTCAGISAVMAAMVMSTKTSIKASLAWSTSAQLGFMLVQCGLGLYRFALFHLVAHSLYKAHAFLAAGSVRALPRASPVSLWRLIAAIAPAAAMVPFSPMLALILGMAAPVLATLPLSVAYAYLALCGAVHATVMEEPVLGTAAIVASMCSVVLALWQCAVSMRARWLKRLYPHALAGFYFDALFTVALERLWPAPQLRAPLAHPSLQGDQK